MVHTSEESAAKSVRFSTPGPIDGFITAFEVVVCAMPMKCPASWVTTLWRSVSPEAPVVPQRELLFISMSASSSCDDEKVVVVSPSVPLP